jgi:hypothetical protein
VDSLGPGALVIAVVVLIWVVARQLQARPLAVKTLFTVPAIMALLGLLLLARGARSGHGLTSADMAWLGADLGLAVVSGVFRAPTVRLFQRDGSIWRQGGPLTIALWAVSLGVRVGIGVMAAHNGAGAGVDDSVLLSFGVSLAVQYAVLVLRARRYPPPRSAGHPRHRQPVIDRADPDWAVLTASRPPGR